jgi:RNA polymerase subunit RPABC4/transcription elongation factor Spt4
MSLLTCTTEVSGLHVGQAESSARSACRTSRQLCPVWMSENKPTVLSRLHVGQQADSSVRSACRTTSRQLCPVCMSDNKPTVLSGLHVGQQADSPVRSACRTTSRQLCPVCISDNKTTALSGLHVGRQANSSVRSASRNIRRQLLMKLFFPLASCWDSASFQTTTVSYPVNSSPFILPLEAIQSTLQRTQLNTK